MGRAYFVSGRPPTLIEAPSTDSPLVALGAHSHRDYERARVDPWVSRFLLDLSLRFFVLIDFSALVEADSLCRRTLCELCVDCVLFSKFAHKMIGGYEAQADYYPQWHQPYNFVTQLPFGETKFRVFD